MARYLSRCCKIIATKRNKTISKILGFRGNIDFQLASGNERGRLEHFNHLQHKNRLSDLPRATMLQEKTLFRLSHMLSHREERIALPSSNKKCDSLDSYTIPNPSRIIVAATALRDEYASLSTPETTATVSSAPSD